MPTPGLSASTTGQPAPNAAFCQVPGYPCTKRLGQLDRPERNWQLAALNEHGHDEDRDGHDSGRFSQHEQ